MVQHDSEKAEEFEINAVVYRRRNQLESMHKMDFKCEVPYRIVGKRTDGSYKIMGSDKIRR